MNFKRYGTFAHVFEGQPEEKAYAWSISHVKAILKDETYIGNSVHNKQSTVSYKNKKRVRRPEEEWFRVEDTHEAIIPKEVFDQVQGQIANRRRQMKDATTQIFAGLVRCADCGWSMSFATNRSNKTPFSYFNCTSYRQFGKNGGSNCSTHYIRYDVLYAYVLSRMQHWARCAEVGEEQLLRQLVKTGDKERTAAAKKRAGELAKAEKRKTEVDRLFAKMYEDWSAERITDYNFNMLSQKYQTEQQELTEKIDRLKADMASEQQTVTDAGKWVALIRQYANPTELTAALLNTLIEKIVVHEAVKDADGSREQEVEIFYRFVGKID